MDLVLAGLGAAEVPVQGPRPFRFDINSIDVRTQKADDDHSDSDWLTIIVAVGDAATKDRPRTLIEATARCIAAAARLSSLVALVFEVRVLPPGVDRLRGHRPTIVLVLFAARDGDTLARSDRFAALERAPRTFRPALSRLQTDARVRAGPCPTFPVRTGPSIAKPCPRW